jgi:hypothetical protein
VDLKLITFLIEYVSPVCLPSQSEVGEPFVGETMTVSGWGRESDSASSIARVNDYLLPNYRGQTAHTSSVAASSQKAIINFSLPGHT